LNTFIEFELWESFLMMSFKINIRIYQNRLILEKNTKGLFYLEEDYKIDLSKDFFYLNKALATL
jgi:hypothetical protein